MSSYLDAIAAIGGGSLHPGGFHHTLKVLRNLVISKDDIVIDVGCGTGRTACHLKKSCRAHVFALDNSETMLTKARSRAEREGADVQFVLGDVLDMPFRDNVADLIMIESVLIFLPVHKGVKECYRVLKNEGILVDVELLAKETLPYGVREQVMSVCGLPQIPTFGEWQHIFEEAGFDKITASCNNFPGPLDNLLEILYGGLNPLFLPELIRKINLSQPLQEYQALMKRYRRYFGFGTFIYRKSLVGKKLNK